MAFGLQMVRLAVTREVHPGHHEMFEPTSHSDAAEDSLAGGARVAVES